MIGPIDSRGILYVTEECNEKEDHHTILDSVPRGIKIKPEYRYIISGSGDVPIPGFRFTIATNDLTEYYASVTKDITEKINEATKVFNSFIAKYGNK